MTEAKMIDSEMNVTTHQHFEWQIDIHSAPVLVRILTSSIVYESQRQLPISGWALADLAKSVKALEVAHEAIATHLDACRLR